MENRFRLDLDNASSMLQLYSVPMEEISSRTTMRWGSNYMQMEHEKSMEITYCSNAHPNIHDQIKSCLDIFCHISDFPV